MNSENIITGSENCNFQKLLVFEIQKFVFQKLVYVKLLFIFYVCIGI